MEMTDKVLADLDANKLIYKLSPTASAISNQFTTNTSEMTTTTDHMITAVWNSSTGWAAPELKPYGYLGILPTASCLQYATECFEGLKVYRGYDGTLRLFRPDLNCSRMCISASRVSLPTFSSEHLLRLIMALVAVDCPNWLPRDRSGSFLYIRPTLIGTHGQLGPQVPKEAMLYIIVANVPPLDSPAGGLRLLTSPQDRVRSWVGGFGYAKVGASYGPSLVTEHDARNRGFHQVLWLHGDEDLTEAGGSNFFVVWKRQDGKKEIITAPLDDKLILDGITRRSTLELLRQRMAGELEVVERKFTVSEIADAHVEGRLLEAFTTGTAVSKPEQTW